ncbi:MAG: alpha/beta hydrolase [Trebonia sp.]|jgi:pimeloyl-ACP methyl ester carboxylesterase
MTQTGQQQANGYAPANGAGIYWESRGSGGTPLVLLHGGYGLASVFDGLAGQLAANRQVVALELRGHGHTADTDRPFSWDDFGDDVAAVIAHLGLGPVDLLGYSLGGSAGLRCAIRHPAAVRKLVVISSPCRRSAWFPEVIAGFDQMSGATLFDMMRQSPLYAEWSKVAPDPSSFPTLIDKTGVLLRRPYDWSAEVGQLEVPAQLVYGDSDSIPPSHAAEFYALLGGGQRDAGWDGGLPTTSRLAIVPGRTHYNILDSPVLPAIIAEFCG